MNQWESRYLPPDPLLWHGRTDIPHDSCFYQRMRFLNLLKETPVQSAPITFAILGFKCDEGVQRDQGRTGAAEGPTAIRQRLAKLPIQKSNIDCYDAGDIVCHDHDLEASQAALAEVIARLLKAKIRPIVIGGGHEVALGQYLGINKVFPHPKRLGILNFDAHLNLQPVDAKQHCSTMTSFYQISAAHQADGRTLDYNCLGVQHAANIRQSFDLAKKSKVKLILADEVHQGLQEKCFDFVDRIIDENEIIYTSLALDVFAPAFAPGVSNIQPLGLNPWHIIPLIRQVASSAKVVSYDIAEYVPRFDIDHRTAKLAATLIYEIIHHHNEHLKP